eukprot:CAMPEP_0206586322 /NCGR_PEP_ID=MMETSP0325_2-20121206/36949_1 /ASSEMBLY_ACC=CAM_ASM_000347 /TAXON_ID=2866 /ORGANISM="Crypthecodinium cohnii, Strain Seligo" /LENGTH=123 /DNA_ID=CAMNT_0054094049 /DNA_START=1130 /DNA_END=1501 /DNA_ORIENTATION=+
MAPTAAGLGIFILLARLGLAGSDGLRSLRASGSGLSAAIALTTASLKTAFFWGTAADVEAGVAEAVVGDAVVVAVVVVVVVGGGNSIGDRSFDTVADAGAVAVDAPVEVATAVLVCATGLFTL